MLALQRRRLQPRRRLRLRRRQPRRLRLRLRWSQLGWLRPRPAWFQRPPPLMRTVGFDGSPRALGRAIFHRPGLWWRNRRNRPVLSRRRICDNILYHIFIRGGPSEFGFVGAQAEPRGEADAGAVAGGSAARSRHRRSTHAGRRRRRNHTFCATGITAYLKNGGTLENAAAMANHASTRTTQLYDRRRDEVERISI